MKILKFGGSSVSSFENFQRVKNIIVSTREPVLVVVSALQGVTDQLIAISEEAAKGKKSYKLNLSSLLDRHLELLTEIKKSVFISIDREQEIHQLLDELSNILQGLYLLKDLSTRTQNTILSYGERLSSLLLAAFLPKSSWCDSLDFIFTEDREGRVLLNDTLTTEHIKKRFDGVKGGVFVIPGFISSDYKTREITNLGRGGADYTAALLAASLNAESLEIWTDVDGFMTADPKVISKAYTIKELSYIEATELCNFGAKIVYPPTIYPVYHKNIPIRIKNTFNPSHEGTIIKRVCSFSEKPIKGISSIKETSLITVQGLGMVGVIGVNSRIFRALAKGGISVFLVAQASSENSTSIGVRTVDAETSCFLLNEEFQKEIELGSMATIKAVGGLSTVAIVGENMRSRPGIAGKLFDTLGRNGINVKAFVQGASETNISCVIDSSLLRKTLNVIHDSFFLSEYQVLNLFICGIGTVGCSLIEQIKSQQERLKEERGLKLNVVGIAKGDRAIFDRHGLDLASYREAVLSGESSSTSLLLEHILSMNIYNPVFVDCTASSEVAGIYEELLSHNISVVAANKIAASSSYRNYANLKQIARNRGVKFLFETNVGAGLPIINTINDLINSGDKILKIEAVLSGTLNYIFNALSEKDSFSDVVKKAQELGYSEPDPRIDLSGVDVVRKLVILAREAGYVVEQEEVEVSPLLPADFFEGDLSQFWETLPMLNERFEKYRAEVEADEQRLRFVAKYEEGKLSVGLVRIPKEHPFYALEGSNNIILLTTDRYKEYPMLIQGYGAGAGVTAAGVFADIMSIANV